MSQCISLCGSKCVCQRLLLMSVSVSVLKKTIMNKGNELYAPCVCAAVHQCVSMCVSGCQCVSLCVSSCHCVSLSVSVSQNVSVSVSKGQGVKKDNNKGNGL